MPPDLIAANDFSRQWRDVETDVLAAVAAVGARGWYVLGTEVQSFEAALASFWGLDDAVGVASGLDALEIALRVLGCSRGDRVLTSPISAFATTLAIVKLGAVPVFADCQDNGLIDLACCRRMLEADARIRFFVPVHLYGHSLDLDELASLRDRFDLKIVEDCAQSIGALFHGRPTGSVGEMAATSFYPTKNLGALGDGGAVLTRTAAHVAVVRSMRDYGQTAKYRHEVLGYNSRLDELQAAILHRACLPRLDAWTARRRQIATAYRDGIRNPHIRIPEAPFGSDSSYHLFPVLVQPGLKASAMDYLRQVGIGVGEHYPATILDQPAMRSITWEGETPRARTFCASEISLPVHPYLSDEEVARVTEACNGWRP